MAAKKRNKKHRRKAAPSQAHETEVIEVAPGIRATRAGRAVRLENTQTPEQHAEFLRRFEEMRAKVMEEFDDKVRKLRDLLRVQSPLHLLADLTIGSVVVDPETYKEYEPRPSAIHVEWPTWLVLTNGPRPTDLYEPADPEPLAQASTLIRELVDNTVMFLHTTTLGSDSTAKEIIQSRTRRTNLLVRSPAYVDHHWEVLEALFAARTDDLLRIAGVGWATFAAPSRRWAIS